MRSVLFKCMPFAHESLTLALESGVDAVIVPDEQAETAAKLSRIPVIRESDMPFVRVGCKSDEESVAARLKAGEKLVVENGWEIIPVENLLASCTNVVLEVSSLEQAVLACGILQKGADGIAVEASAAAELKEIVAKCKLSQGTEQLEKAVITRIEDAGMGHRVCIDTMTLMKQGQGMLVGNSGAFTFLVHAETSRNEYVASRPFRVNAGAVHAYLRLADDRTCYLGELEAGRRVLIVNADGSTQTATVGRVKTEIRPMLLVEAEVAGTKGAVFLQNAETICLTRPDGTPVSVVKLSPGDEILCRTDEAGRHFGMRVKEDIVEH